MRPVTPTFLALCLIPSFSAWADDVQPSSEPSNSVIKNESVDNDDSSEVEDSFTFTPSGEYQLRYRHNDNYDFFTKGNAQNYLKHRARIGARFSYGDKVSAFLQAQDVRIWGEETDTLTDFSANGLDMHQAYVDVALLDGLRLIFGRQEINYLNQRLIGSVAFAEQMRSFDAIRLTGQFLDNSLSLDAFYARISHRPGATAIDDLFAWNAVYSFSGLNIATIGVLDSKSKADKIRYTQGLLLDYSLDFGLDLSLEGYLQDSHLAWMTAFHAKYTFDLKTSPFVEAFIEVLSGDKDLADNGSTTFNTLFATNHSRYGLADMFSNIPVDTNGRGLLDAGFAIGFSPLERLSAQLAFHHFEAVQTKGLSNTTFAQELDLTATWALNKHLSGDFNYSILLPGKRLGTNARVENYIYITANAHF